MNWRFLRSPHAMTGAAAGLATAAWGILTGTVPWSADRSDRFFLMTTGWLAAALFALVLAYLFRKYAHKLGISPEFRLKVPIASLEAAERRIRTLEARERRRAGDADGQLLREAARELKSAGVHRVMRATLDDQGRIDLRPTQPLGRTASWVEMHIHFGFWWGLVVLFHGRAMMDSPMGFWLNLASAGVWVTGVIGAFFWAFGPTWLTRAERKAGISVERAFVLDQGLDRKIRRIAAAIGPEKLAALQRLRTPEERRRFAAAEPSPELADWMIFVEQRKSLGARLGTLLRLKFLINSWRLVHVPIATLLLALVIAHVIWVYRF